jgi:hypothetical protein
MNDFNYEGVEDGLVKFLYDADIAIEDAAPKIVAAFLADNELYVFTDDFNTARDASSVAHLFVKKVLVRAGGSDE